MRLLRRDGALTIRDIEDDVLTEKEHLWQSRKPSKRALQLAFYTGEVTISERSFYAKLTERFPQHVSDEAHKNVSQHTILFLMPDRANR